MPGDAQKAIFFYKGYLRNSPKAHNRVEVEQKIAALQKQLSVQEPACEGLPPPGPFAAGQSGSQRDAARDRTAAGRRQSRGGGHGRDRSRRLGVRTGGGTSPSGTVESARSTRPSRSLAGSISAPPSGSTPVVGPAGERSAIVLRDIHAGPAEYTFGNPAAWCGSRTACPGCTRVRRGKPTSFATTQIGSSTSLTSTRSRVGRARRFGNWQRPTCSTSRRVAWPPRRVQRSGERVCKKRSKSGRAASGSHASRSSSECSSLNFACMPVRRRP